MIDSNAAQFARLGNPWITAREQQELGNSPDRTSRKIKHNLAFKPRPFDPAYRDAIKPVRPLTPEEERAKRHRDALAKVRGFAKAERGEINRAFVGPPPKEPYLTHLTVQRDAELDPWDPQALAATGRRLAAAHAAAVARNAQLRQDRIALLADALDEDALRF